MHGAGTRAAVLPHPWPRQDGGRTRSAAPQRTGLSGP